MTVRKKIIKRKVSAPGCDDAPYVTVSENAIHKPFTLIVPYYENPQALAWQTDRWSRYAAGLMRVIVVDDGSPDNPAPTSLWYDLYRIEVDVRWNWLAARNIGAHMAEPGWILLTDMDHVIPPATMERLLWGEHDPSIIYRFSRSEADGTPVHPHPNSWFMTRDMFWRIGGYDEALSGYYGTDGEYRRRAAATAPIRILTDKLVRHEFYLDASTTRYERKQPEDAVVQMRIASRGKDWKPRVLSFPWHAVPLA